MQRYHELFNYKSAFRILSKGRVVLAVSAFFSGTTLLFAAPTGGVVTTGNASISSGSSTTTITQTTNKASINWQSFNIAPSESVNFVQPNSSSVTLNRVVGTSNSLIEGALNANGQVFLINPNGVIFGNGAQVNVGGIVATTLNISDADFQAGNYKFSGDSTASVLNMGTINVASGGYAVLAGKNVENSGLIAATLGNVQLTGTSAMTLNLNGNSLVNLTIDKGTLDALVANKGIIKADGGIVYLTTQALDTVLNGMVNNTGIIEANSLDTQNGKVVLYAHGGTTNVDGTLSVTNGSLETSGELLHVSDTTTIKAKSWLLDPTNITIASGGAESIAGTPATTTTTGDVTISASTIDNVLNGGTNVTLTATNNITVNQDMTWSSINKLILAADSINVNNTINNTNVTNGGVYFQAANTTDNVIFGVNGKVIINNPFQLQWMNTALAGTYQLGSNIDASATSTWNSDAGFVPIGNDTTNFTGTFDGLGHTISNLTINIPSNNYVGLFGYTSSTAVIKNVGLVNENVKGAKYVGGLVGQKYNGDISNSYATGSVSGSNYVGGLVGSNTGTISTSYATGSVSGTSDVGGLVGSNYGGTISNSYATGSVSGTGSFVGGLVGYNNGDITNSYATGKVSGPSYIGGLVGYNGASSSISKSYWDIDSTGQSAGLGGGSNTDLAGLTGIYSTTSTINAYSSGTYVGFDFTNTWFMVQNSTRPFLRSEYSTTISNDHQLQLMALDLGATYTLAANIDATETGAASATTPVYSGMWANTGFVPIGNIDTSFTGTFNGLGHTISNLTINTSSSYVGLFGVTSEAVIKNVGLVNENVKGANYVGGLVGRNYSGGTISNSYTTGSVIGTFDVGGLVGYNYSGTISNSYTTGSVIGTNGDVGGLVGSNSGTISTSYATGSVIGTNGDVGGLVGSNIGNITNSYATGSVIGTGSDVGGLVGLNFGNITNSYWDIDSTGKSVGVGVELSGPSTTLIGIHSFTGANAYSLATYSYLNIAEMSNTTNPTSTWVIIDGYTRPFLRSEYSTTISNDHQLQLMAMNLNATYTLAANIDATGIGAASGTTPVYSGMWANTGFVPIGNIDTSFTGTFDGLGHTISGLTINTSSDYVGLFGSTSSTAVIKNVGLVNENVKGAKYVGGLVGANYGGTISNSYATGSVSGSNYVGGLVGYNDPGTISNSYATGSVSGTDNVGGLVGYNNGGTITDSYAKGSVSGSKYVGGLVGDSSTDGHISNSYATGSVNGTDDYVGGLVGHNGGTISNSYATGSVSATGSNVGGLVGLNNNNGTISTSYATGSVSGTGYYVGGLVGANYSGDISNSYATGEVISTGTGTSYYVGGLVGYNNGKITTSYATGNVSGTETIYYVGGLVGQNYNKGEITNSYATGNVGGTGTEIYLGGLVGDNTGTITTSYATGSVSGYRSVGGLVGQNSGTISKSFWDTETSGMSTDGASSGTTGKTTAEMKNIATFTGWNIHIDDSLSNVYPQLKGVGIESYWVIGSYAGSHDTSIANQEVTRKTPTNILAPIANQAVTHETPAGLDHPDFHPEAPRLVSSASGETMAGGRYVSFTNGGMRLPTGLEQDDESNNNQRRGR